MLKPTDADAASKASRSRGATCCEVGHGVTAPPARRATSAAPAVQRRQSSRSSRSAARRDASTTSLDESLASSVAPPAAAAAAAAVGSCCWPHLCSAAINMLCERQISGHRADGRAVVRRTLRAHARPICACRSTSSRRPAAMALEQQKTCTAQAKRVASNEPRVGSVASAIGTRRPSCVYSAADGSGGSTMEAAPITGMGAAGSSARGGGGQDARHSISCSSARPSRISWTWSPLDESRSKVASAAWVVGSIGPLTQL